MSEQYDNNQQTPDPDYWRSFKELYRDPAVVEQKHHEFLDGAKDDFDPNKNLSGISRKKFLALVGASAALAAAGCSDYRDKGKILPYNKKPEEVILGIPNYYASTCSGCASACGIMVKTREGRPVKVDGNPDHPVSKGKTCSKGQAATLNLYDPARIREPKVKKSGMYEQTSWLNADEQIVSALKAANGKEIALIANSVVSPSFVQLINEFKLKYPSTVVYSYELFTRGTADSAWQKLYGSSRAPIMKINEAELILSIEGDLLGTDGNRVEQQRMYSETKDIKNKKFSRMYAVEANLTLTGLNADYRLALRPDMHHAFVMSLLSEMIKKGNSIALDSAASAELGKYNLNAFVEKYGLNKKYVAQLVSDLLVKRGKTVIFGGKQLSEETHIAIYLLNELLGNTVLYKTNDAEVSQIAYSTTDELKQLVGKMNAGNVAAIIHLDSNPVYHFASEIGYEKALAKVPLVVSLTEQPNETSAVSNFVLPLNNMLESWGDAKTRESFIALQQPVIAPLFNTRQKEGVLWNWMQEKFDGYNDNTYHEYVKNYWLNNIFPAINSPFTFERFFIAALHDGFIEQKTGERSFSYNSAATVSLAKSLPTSSGMAVILSEHINLGDGKYAGNGWLQELPHPITKVTWDNYASLSEKTGKKLGLKDNDVIEVAIGNRKVKLPVVLQPGCADDTVAVELGFGRKNSSIVAEAVGVNANVLLGSELSVSPYVYYNASVTKTGGTYEVVSTQDHYSYDDELTKDIHYKRDIIQEGTVKEYLADSKFLEKKRTHHPDYQIYNEVPYPGMKWGMAIDLNKCIGCGACAVACQSENNIPVVGKDQVKAGREMNWMRIDRYYSGTPEEPKVSVQPMLCQHCDNAPCENVCPVVATTHSPDGLNQMVYNRCVGTRYCSNNCPYKVRRFNFFDFRDHFRAGVQYEDSMELIANPEVTVRSRGVMEKCTFCIQRIHETKYRSIAEGRESFKGSEVKTACQVACGTNAIMFGDVNDKESDIYAWRHHDLGYHLLEILNVKPNVTYIAKLRNVEEA